MYLPFDLQIRFILHGHKELFAVVVYISVYILTEKEYFLKIKIKKKISNSFCKILKNNWYHVEVTPHVISSTDSNVRAKTTLHVFITDSESQSNTNTIHVHTRYIPCTIPVPYQYHTSTIPVPYQYHTSPIPVPYHYHT